MGYSGMTMSALEDQPKATFKLFVAAQNVAAYRDFDQGKRDEHAVTIAKLNRTIGEKAKVEEELSLVQGAELSKSQEELGEANCKIEAFASELRSCYDDAMKDYVGSAEYHEKLAAQRVERYFDLINKVGEKYPSLDWRFLGSEVGEAEAGVDRGGGTDVVMGSSSESVIQEPSLRAKVV
ncbi:uncharacterized protein Pyn_36855 [Prunus yedoensis var. nudiflora]|uniref:Uncharacterized protein n=1 Tax=Prunus yedoensis var. nudiflora TaxID=2094558 RepID=A0A314ZRQ0_PRUYE|nr:uncharacterized protein Pyn_36855 [Prunus yedoensis var. nudiflora]